MKNLKAALAIGLTATTLAFSAPKPALADGAASTRNIILGAAAVITGLAIESNAAHKNAEANTIEGYLPDGSAVYANGEVVEQNGESFYPGNQNQSVACDDGACRITDDTTNGTWNGPQIGFSNGSWQNYRPRHDHNR